MSDTNSGLGGYFISNVKFALQLISKKWVIDILMVLTGDSLRFSEIEKYLPQLSSKVLSDRLSELQHYNIINKNVTSITPLMVHYTVAPAGLAILRALSQISKIGSDMKEAVEES